MPHSLWINSTWSIISWLLKSCAFIRSSICSFDGLKSLYLSSIAGEVEWMKMLLFQASTSVPLPLIKECCILTDDTSTCDILWSYMSSVVVVVTWINTVRVDSTEDVWKDERREGRSSQALWWKPHYFNVLEKKHRVTAIDQPEVPVETLHAHSCVNREDKYKHTSTNKLLHPAVDPQFR